MQLGQRCSQYGCGSFCDLLTQHYVCWTYCLFAREELRPIGKPFKSQSMMNTNPIDVLLYEKCTNNIFSIYKGRYILGVRVVFFCQYPFSIGITIVLKRFCAFCLDIQSGEDFVPPCIAQYICICPSLEVEKTTSQLQLFSSFLPSIKSATFV